MICQTQDEVQSAYWNATHVTMHTKMEFSIKETADLIPFTEEILNGKLHFCRSGNESHETKIMMKKLLIILLIVTIYSRNDTFFTRNVILATCFQFLI